MNAKEVEQSVFQSITNLESDLKEGAYAKRTANDGQLPKIIQECKLNANGSYLDIGTGHGDVAFKMSEICPEASVTGIDIVDSVLQLDREKAQAMELQNVRFTTFNGVELPFHANEFDGVMARYSLHHFPKADCMARDISRVLKPGGLCFISDPILFANDTFDFANKFSRLREDGHVKYFTQTSLKQLFENVGMKAESIFYTEITVSRQCTEAYQALIESMPQAIKVIYKLTMDNGMMGITMPVINIIFKKVE